MPGLARKIIVCAAIDGLIIQPLSSKGQKPHLPIRVKYGDASISNVARAQVPDLKPEASFEAFGVIGLVTVSRLSYLITITRRQQVAQILGYPIYVATEVAITPCSSQADAEKSVKETSLQLRRDLQQDLSDDQSSSGDEADTRQKPVDEADDVIEENAGAKSNSRRSSFVEDVIRKKGSYGRFAQRWFSRSGWTIDQQRNMGLSVSPTLPPSNPSISSLTEGAGEQVEDVKPLVSSLLPKLLRTLHVLFGTSQSFYFSYDVDITRSFKQSASLFDGGAPACAHVDSVFFWNHNIIQPFVAAGQDAVSLPVMQGFIGQRSFLMDSQPPQKDETAPDSHELYTLSPTGSMPSSPPNEKTLEAVELRPTEKSYLLTLISRRSTKRGGLRYLRRGVDEGGFTANFVETEQILSPSVWNQESRIYSFLQIRGSIPLFFTQTPFSMKPAPVMLHATETNFQACKKHFERLVRIYGKTQVVNLVEKHGIEAPLGAQFEKSVQRLREEAGYEQQVSFEWFDFHRACRGMKFENVSILLLKLKDKLEELGCTIWEGGVVRQEQQGVIRTNCMDCLDRTNVCQSSFARHILDSHLRQEGFDVSAQMDQTASWFNTLWADNGDAISKQYASTAAMKGDYTRTRKRDYRGALNDLGLSLTRFYNGMVNDYFSQATIDFLLGNVTATVFDEFEADMMTKDPAVSVLKLREQAVELCQRRVVADETEEFHGGWVLISPSTTGTVKSWPMEEVVLLLTDAALYLCRLDWESDKVSSFERVELSTLTHIKFGTYITSTMSPSHMDEAKNVGFVVSYEPDKSHVKRTNTRTLSSHEDLKQSADDKDAKDASHAATLIGLMSGRPAPSQVRKIAFKAPYTSSSTVIIGSGPQQTEMQQVVAICTEIERLAAERQPRKLGESRESIVQKDDIISLEEAKRNTGLLEQLGHSIKRLVWA
ncbi:SacI homology domain-containing protein [Stachybotrys elegans]|uniref:SacI homology domain-containing protein n=1 Tax=Stachybotrys elegans TaxID=80388 RepID=A0A8K0WVH5_9HYPO|nr:SacI homology domain-containing protein [Stachybotrys elegans]